VIAGGIDHIYPMENKDLYEKIANNGLIVAELPIGSSPVASHFPQRNRIISGISIATSVIEAAKKSGSLITANFAKAHKREIFAMPGSPLDNRCGGTNALIKDGAHLLESAEYIMNVVNEPERSIDLFSDTNDNYLSPSPKAPTDSDVNRNVSPSMVLRVCFYVRKERAQISNLELVCENHHYFKHFHPGFHSIFHVFNLFDE
jgi:predicted Rossmann fold nucleotide-binding protein DprA/Smf involved in DNA uptake